jgi:hypothetical protein
MKILKTTLFLLLLGAGCSAQIHFDVIGAPGYSVAYDVGMCESDYCYGDLSVEIRKKGSGAVQRFRLETDFAFDSRDEGREKPFRVPYREQSVVRFADYNFDGAADLAIQNGREGGYSGASYDVYLYSPRAGKFVLNEKLSSLATAPYLGMFEVDRKRRVIRTSQKSGCCMHQTEEFKYFGSRLVKVFDEYEDAFSTGGKRVEITTRRLVNGKWRKTVRYRKID